MVCAVLAPMSPPKSSKRSRSAAPAADTAPESANAEAADEEVAVMAPTKSKTPGKQGHGSAGADAPPSVSLMSSVLGVRLSL